MKKVMILATAVAVALTSCMTGGVEKKKASTGEITTKVQLVMGTRAAAGAVEDQDAMVIGEGSKLVFADADDKVKVVVSIVSGDAEYAGGEVGLNALKNGATFTEIPEESTKVYFVGNIPAAVSIVAGTVMTNLTTSVSQQYSNGTVDKVVLVGVGDMEETANEKVYEASITVKPLAARLEIGEVKDTYTANAYKVTGIFVNDYYSEVTLYGMTTGEVKNNNEADYAKGAGIYTNALEGVVYDYAAAGLTLGADNVWAYNLLAPTADGVSYPTGTPAPGLYTPYLVLRLATAAHGDIMADETRWLVVTLKDVEELEAGKVYKISSITFSSQSDQLGNPPGTPANPITGGDDEDGNPTGPVVPGGSSGDGGGGGGQTGVSLEVTVVVDPWVAENITYEAATEE